MMMDKATRIVTVRIHRTIMLQQNVIKSSKSLLSFYSHSDSGSPDLATLIEDTNPYSFFCVTDICIQIKSSLFLRLDDHCHLLIRDYVYLTRYS